jgi:hypothetical protein
MKTTNLTLTILFVGFFSLQINAQDTIQTNSQLNFFLDCWDCDFTFVRQELEFISFVRDPKLADVHILVTESRTGSGGRKYFMNFIGLKKFDGVNFEYEYASEQTETDDEIRRGLLKLIQTGILQYYSISGKLNEIEIGLKHSGEKTAAESVEDPWKKWVFRLSTGGDFQKEASQNEYSLESEIRIEKVKEEWKTRLEADYDIFRENYYDEGEKISNRQDQTEVQANFIKSLTSRWSAGVFGFYQAATYLNIKNSVRGSLGIEYNIFPWDISNRKVFTFRYQIGARTYSYNEITIYDKLNENLFYHSAEINLELVQPWGRIEASLEGRNYFHDFSKNRLTLFSNFSVRLTKQLSVYSHFYGRLIHDQLYLPKGDASLEDLLLKRRKLQTTYEIGGQLGIRFTFGSIYSNVVNERF